jgi:uracil permease
MLPLHKYLSDTRLHNIWGNPMEGRQEKMKNDNTNLGTGKTVVLGLQHTFTMFGATVLVPILTGFDVSVALFMAGAGTLIFHLLTNGGVPIFLGSSFAFIIPTVSASTLYGMEYASGGIAAAGLVYLVLAILVFFLGAEKILSFFPPIITGPIIIVIGLNLAPVAIENASGNWWLALLGFTIVVCVNIYFKGFLKLLPVLIGFITSYVIAALLTAAGFARLVDFAPVAEAAWVGLPKFTMAKFDARAIILIVPVTVCTIIEHIGDMVAVGAMSGRDYIKKPGLHRTLLGDGLATSLSAMFGGPANTTYSENTGVLALTGVFNPVVIDRKSVV